MKKRWGSKRNRNSSVMHGFTVIDVRKKGCYSPEVTIGCKKRKVFEKRNG